MNFVVFPVGTTNIFPLANSAAGGQLLSEYNIRARESVATDAAVKYFIGSSFTHSMDDYAVYCQRDGYDATISSTTIQIQPGRALVNGHYVELLAPINIDINDANTIAAKEGLPALKGKLAVGLKMAYSTYQTLAGSALVENEDSYYEGVQVVIVPATSVKLPKDVPGETDFTKVNMHLLLATFTYRNGTVSSVVQNPRKIQSVDAERIANIEEMLSDTFISKSRLDPNRMYGFSGKSADGEHLDGRDTWCDITDSTVVWDNNPTVTTSVPSREAYFMYDEVAQQTVLVAPHKQIDGMHNMQGTPVYYQDKIISLPGADYTLGKGGVVTPEYTSRIKNIEQKIDLFYRLPNGRMRQYVPILLNRDELPLIPVSQDTKWPYSYSEYTLDISGLEAKVSKISTDLANLQSTLEDTIKGEIQNTAKDFYGATVSQLVDQVDNIRNELNDLQNKFSVLDERDTTSERLVERVSDLELQVTRLIDKVEGDQGLSSMVNELTTNWKQYEATTTGHVEAEVEAAIATLSESVTTFISEIQSQFSTLTQYVDDKVKEALDSRSIFTTWTWQPGDYVLVGEDHTVGGDMNGRYPSTMYVVGPGQVRAVRYLENQDIITVLSTAHGTNSPEYIRSYETMLMTVPQQLAGGIQLDSRELASADQGGATGVNLWEPTAYKGAPGIDYFVARYKVADTATQTETWTCYYYTPSLTDTRYSYLDPVWITGGVPLATETSVGGFVNVPSGSYGNGYVRLNDDGYLQIVDYELLLTGVLSYQLGQDYSEGSGLSAQELQTILEENINDRVCFPNAAQIESAAQTGADPYVINLYIDLPESGDLEIHDIGSRYGSCLYVHIGGSGTSNTTITFRNCDKLRIDSNIEGGPNIKLDTVCLYYDAEVLDACLPTASDDVPIQNLTLWYQQFDATDANLQVDGMTVELMGEIESTEGIDPWDSTYANDNHYSYALRSLTLASDGTIINVGMLVGDSTTANIDEGKSVFAAEFILPQSIGFNYPASKMTHRIKVTGSFVSHYYIAAESAYMMKHTDFSALTQKYDPITKTNVVGGTISFYTDAEVISHINGVSPTTTIDGWDLNTPHYFIGGVIE